MKLGIYIDSHNLWFGKTQLVQEHGRIPSATEIDYGALLSLVQGRRLVSVARAYIVYHPGNHDTTFETALSMLGIECRAKYAHDQGPRATRTWDTQLTMDAIHEHERWDVLCLVSNSRAFLPLVEHITINERKAVELYGFSQRMEWARNIVDTLQGGAISVHEIDGALRKRS